MGLSVSVGGDGVAGGAGASGVAGVVVAGLEVSGSVSEVVAVVQLSRGTVISKVVVMLAIIK